MTQEIKKVTEDMRVKLRAPLPPEAITTHPTKSYLSSIKPIYVTERLNQVFGVGSWQTKSELIQQREDGTVVTKTTITIPEYGIYYEAYGGNNNGGQENKNFDLGDAFKGSVTDAITKICSWMEIGIDVFKGKSSTKIAPNKAPTKTKELEVLTENHKSFAYVKQRVKEGIPLTTIEQNFLLTEEIKKLLQQ